MGVVSNNWFDRVLLPILYLFKPLVLTDVQTPFVGTPLVPLRQLHAHLDREDRPGPGQGLPTPTLYKSKK